MSDNTGSKMFFSFLTGAAIGAGLALLFAPQSGKETRKQIKDFSEKLSGEVKDEVEKLSERAKGFVEGRQGHFFEKIQDLSGRPGSGAIDDERIARAQVALRPRGR